MSARRIAILGATGSVGKSTIAVIEELRAGGHELEIEALTCGGKLAELVQLARQLRPKFVAIADPGKLAELRAALPGVEAGAGRSAIVEAAARPSDWLMSSIVGVAGLEPTLAAVKRGAVVALANKESMVCAGPLVRAEAAKAGATLLPVDSEHNAIFQVLSTPEAVEKLTLTASGGPFRTKGKAELARVTLAEALNHPTWKMGPKITIDSATLMNKGLELIEAAYLFDMPQERIDVVIHPQSIIHSLVSYVDGSVLAQLSAPDMRVPIAHALAWPNRAAVSTKRLDLTEVGTLTFEAPDLDRFPALRLARTALQTGGGATAALNAANEMAVESFLGGTLGFLDIARVAEETLAALGSSEPGLIANSPSSFDEVRTVDQAARDVAGRIVARLAAA